MPNTFFIRCVVRGPGADSIHWEVKGEDNVDADGTPWKEYLLYDPIVGSGDVVRAPGYFAFTTRFGWHIHPDTWVRVARKWPAGCVLRAKGFDYDDFYEGAREGEAVKCMCGPDARLVYHHERLSSEAVAYQHFPQSFVKNRLYPDG